MMDVIAVAIGGGIGAAARYGVDRATPKPWGTMVVNVLGSFALGVIVAIFHSGGSAEEPLIYHALGAGFCGGFTTFSTASLDAMKIGRTDEALNGGTYSLAMLAGCLLSAAVGMAIGTVLSR